VGGAGDRLPLRIVDLLAEHHVDDDSGHWFLPLLWTALMDCLVGCVTADHS
jgi:hypothetical protein